MARQRQSLEDRSEQEQQQAQVQSQLYGVLFAVGIVVVVGLAIYFFVFNNEQSLPELNPDFDIEAIVDNSEEFPVLSRDHIPDSQEREYNSNPPTSGPHSGRWVSPIGVFTTQLSDTMLIHNLEHGHVWISYRDEDDDEAIALLTAIQNKYSDRVVVTYRPENDARIAVTAWSRLMNMNELDSDQIEAFIVRYSDQAPESIMEG